MNLSWVHELEEPIRYGLRDPIERWLYDLLLLDASSADPLSSGMPHPDECQLYLVNRDTLFSMCKSAEKFLRRVYSLFVSSHYKNSPNDLQLLSDAPAHCILVLLGPLSKTPEGSIPDVLCAVQVALEGDISKDKVLENSSRGIKPSGDLIPWTISDQFMDRDFPQLNGLRVVRIAVHPQAQGRGYGSICLNYLKKFFTRDLAGEGELTSFFEVNKYDASGTVKELKDSADLKTKKTRKPLLKALSEVEPPPLHYLGTSFGLTPELHKFWKKNGYSLVYLKQKPNELTGEFSCIMLQDLVQQHEMNAEVSINKNWLETFRKDFEKRFANLLAYQFRTFDLQTCVDVLNPRLTTGSGSLQAEDELEDNNKLSGADGKTSRVAFGPDPSPRSS